MKFVAILVATTLIAGSAGAVVIRHDVPDSAYLIPGSAFPALVALQWDGQGVLIAPRWVVTAAHATQWPMSQVTINGAPRRVSRVIRHPGYRVPARALSDDAATLSAEKTSIDDIALLELAEPVSDTEPAPLYTGSDETGKRIAIIGRGATGNGLTGQAPNSPHRGSLRRAFSPVTSAEGRWLICRFDAPPATDALAGTAGDGDSGGPILIESEGVWKLAGLTSWKYAEGNLADFRAGLYGQISYQVRISHYADWIRGVIEAPVSGVSPL
jgi:secreted trypsin-like serine protease